MATPNLKSYKTKAKLHETRSLSEDRVKSLSEERVKR